MSNPDDLNFDEGWLLQRNALFLVEYDEDGQVRVWTRDGLTALVVDQQLHAIAMQFINAGDTVIKGEPDGG